MSRLIIFLYGILCYIFFFITFLYAIGFVTNIYVPKSIDSGIAVSTTKAIITNMILLSLFALQHIIMARAKFKKILTTFIPSATERSTFVLFTNLALCLMYWQWQPIQGIVWNVTDPTMSLILNIIAGIGWFIVFISTFLIDHFDLFGLKQVYFHFKNKEIPSHEFSKKGFYSWVRHPLMTGFLIAFWSTPTMTYGHLFFALLTTGFIIIDITYFEEPDLERRFGTVYKKYMQEVPMLLPLTKFKKNNAPIANAIIISNPLLFY